VARLLAFTRSGAVGFIDWLDVWRFRTNAHTEYSVSVATAGGL
jgi:hypothetical protein